MIPTVTLHEVYQDFVIEQLQQHYSGGVLTLVHKDWPIITKLWTTDLTGISTMLQDFYSARGPVPRDPSAIAPRVAPRGRFDCHAILRLKKNCRHWQ